MEDIELLNKALINSITSEATTRSKLGQTPRFFLRIEYKEQKFIGDLRDFVKIKPNSGKSLENLREVTDYKLDFNDLITRINNTKESINKIYYWKHDDFDIENFNEIEKLKNLIQKLEKVKL